MALALMAKNGYNAVRNVRNQVVQNAVQNPSVQNVGNQNGIIVVLGLGHLARNCTARPKRRDAAYLQTQLLIAHIEEDPHESALRNFLTKF
ncbi:hypothetical protein Tco_0291231 [Tanacetum coccineum]